MPNYLSIFRLILGPLVGFFFFEWNRVGDERYRTAILVIFAVACLTDALDGWVARRFKAESQLGSILDPLADKTLLNITIASMAFFSHIPESVRLPGFFGILVLMRDMLLVAGALLRFLLKGPVRIYPNPLGKWTTLAQMLLVIALLMGTPRALSSGLLWLAGSLTLLSGWVYLRRGLKELTDDSAARTQTHGMSS